MFKELKDTEKELLQNIENVLNNFVIPTKFKGEHIRKIFDEFYNVISADKCPEKEQVFNMGVTSEYSDQLKSCPFCKGVAYLTHVEFNDGDIWYNPNCEECNCGWKESYETKEEAIEAWNKRK